MDCQRACCGHQPGRLTDTRSSRGGHRRGPPGLLPLKYPPSGNPATSEVCVNDFCTASRRTCQAKYQLKSSNVTTHPSFPRRRESTPRRPGFSPAWKRPRRDSSLAVRPRVGRVLDPFRKTMKKFLATAHAVCDGIGNSAGMTPLLADLDSRLRGAKRDG